MEMTKRGVPGVWTYGFYDGWFRTTCSGSASHCNSIGRFYGRELSGHGPGAVAADRCKQLKRHPSPATERPASSLFPASNGAVVSAAPIRVIQWAPPNINMQESALLLTLNLVAKNREKFLENYYAKNRMMIEQGRTRAPYAYIVPARQRRQVEAAELMNLVRREGAEVHTATGAFTVDGVQVAAGDYIVRLDQPYGGVVETLLGVGGTPLKTPRPTAPAGTFR